MKSKHRVAYLLQPWMELETELKWAPLLEARTGSAGVSLWDVEPGLQVLRGGLIRLKLCYRSGGLQEKSGHPASREQRGLCVVLEEGSRGRELVGPGSEDETRTRLCANQYSLEPSGAR
ncbi:uncharacterized protein V6R79_013951 [Siganus canaliculatus]